MTLEIHSEILTSTQVNLALEGTLDAVTSPRLDEFISHHFDPAVLTVVIDLQKLVFISSAGLRIFAKLRKTLKSKGGTLCFINPSPQVKRVFDIVKAVPVSEVFQDIHELDNYLASMQRKVTESSP